MSGGDHGGSSDAGGEGVGGREGEDHGGNGGVGDGGAGDGGCGDGGGDGGGDGQAVVKGGKKNPLDAYISHMATMLGAKLWPEQNMVLPCA